MNHRRYKCGESREQTILFPERLEEYLSETNPVRAIDAYVESLDLSALGFSKTQVNINAAGQPAYSPQILLKLYLYGYLNRVRSSRLLEKECHRNIEVMWLLQKLVPSYKTIADFRKDNSHALRNTHRHFILMCRELALFGGERVAVDGSFFKGNVSARSFVTVKGLNREINQLDASIEAWLAQLDQSDKEEPIDDALKDDPALAEKLKALREQKQEKLTQLQGLKSEGRTQQSTVDNDARLLSKRGQKTQGYNVQIVSDSKHHLLIATEVTTDPTDLEQLYPMAQQAREALQVAHIEVLADAGYYKGAQIKACLDDKITPYVPEPKRKSAKNGLFKRADFQYDAEQDVFHCPAKCILKPTSKPHYQNSQWQQCYASLKSNCRRCAIREQCLPPKSKNRRISRGEYEDILDVHRERMASYPKIMRERSSAVEHPFGTLKRRAGWDHFLLRGLTKVRGEWSLMAMTYNFTRVINLLGIKQFMAYCNQTRRC